MEKSISVRYLLFLCRVSSGTPVGGRDVRHLMVWVSALIMLVTGDGRVRADSVLDRGRYLVNAVAACANCHTARSPQGPALSGGNRFTVGDKVVFAPNITPDRQTGIGMWTDAQIIAAIRQDVRPDGSRIGPPMPQRAFAAISDADAAAIVAYLRSVPPVSHRVEASVHGPGVPSPLRPQVGADQSISADRGRYLVTGPAHCIECHEVGDRRAARPDRVFKGPWGTVVAPALSTGTLAYLSREAFVRIVTKGVRPDGSRLVGPMPVAAYAGLDANDIAAIADVLTVRR